MRSILLSSGMPEEMKNRISSLTGLRAVSLPGYTVLPGPVRSHPDTLVFSNGDALITDENYYLQNKPLLDGIAEDSGKRIVFSEKHIGEKYPFDVVFNAFAVSGILFGRLDSLSERIKEMFESSVNVNQGYAKCSSCILPDGAVVTADTGIYRAVREKGCDALLIKPGGVSLPGYDTGFIGGASFAYGDAVYFFGSLSRHPEGDKIYKFAERHSRAVCELSDGILSDHGGAVLL